MTRDDIIKMAREARGYPAAPTDGSLWLFSESHLERFFHMAQAAEREACAKVTGEFAQKWWSIHCASNKHMETTRKAHDDFCALQAAIRARGQA
jgi:hypothetical protein